MITLYVMLYVSIDISPDLLELVTIQRRINLIKGEYLPFKWTSVDCGMSDLVGYYIIL